MPMPDFQSMMLPSLEIASDGEIHTTNDVANRLAEHFGVAESKRRELLPSGRQSRFDNRVGWAVTYLKKAQLLESAGRGKFRITERGMNVVKDPPQEININFLRRFPEFREFKAGSGEREEEKQEPETPEEILEQTYQSLRGKLRKELLNQVLEGSSTFFERLVLDVLVAMGYGGSRKEAAQAIGGTGDGGIDGIIKQDRLGLDVVYVQAKRWQGSVGRPVVQAFTGSLEGRRANKGVLITTSKFSSDAEDFVKRIGKKIVLIDGEQLADLMIEHKVGVADVATYEVSRIDLDYFTEES